MEERSTPMTYLQILLPSDAAALFIDRVGRGGLMQFTDLNGDVSAQGRPHMPTLIRAQECERAIQSMENHLADYDIEFDSSIEPDNLARQRQQVAPERAVSEIERDVVKELEELETQVNVEKRLVRQQTEQFNLRRVIRDLDYFLQKERAAAQAFRESGRREDPAFGDVPLLERRRSGDDEESGPSQVNFQFLAGVVPRPALWSFRRQIFLATRGNSYMLLGSEVPFRKHDRTNKMDTESFIIFLLGHELKRRCTSLCRSIGAEILVTSGNMEDARKEAEQLAEEQQYTEQTIHLTRERLGEQMRRIRLKLVNWKARLLQEKGVCTVLDKCRADKNGGNLKVEGWVPTDSIEEIQTFLEASTMELGVPTPVTRQLNNPPKGQVFPTYVRTNKFTDGFNNIVETYGAARYQELNPALPTIITFPFLFGVMYGDLLHGSCIFAIAIGLVLFEREIAQLRGQNEFLDYLHYGRYILLLMGGFAVFCGLIYNDCMSISLWIWESGWDYNPETEEWVFTGPYRVGLDPMWHGRAHQMEFTNSYKMKLAMILGITQIYFGLILKFRNHRFHNDRIAIIWEWIPQMLFFSSFFGYMMFAILHKWTINWQEKARVAPSLISMMVAVALNPGRVTDDIQLFDSRGWQEFLHVIFFLTMLISVPLMLCAKPYMKFRQHQQHRYARLGLRETNAVELPPVAYSAAHGTGEEDEASSEDEKHYEAGDPDMLEPASPREEVARPEFDLQEEMVPQLIHTIEFVLGTVSNTASYLRLWALSLAHAQLAEVFYNKCIREQMESDGSGGLLIGVAVFIAATVGVLLIMDVLECGLHSLRLHWVEFQSKFYHGDGVAFKPFKYESLIKTEAA